MSEGRHMNFIAGFILLLILSMAVCFILAGIAYFILYGFVLAVYGIVCLLDNAAGYVKMYLSRKK